MANSLRRGEEIYRLADGEWFDVGRLEADQAHARHDLLLELRIVELARDHATHGDLACRRDGEFQHQLALQLRLVAQRAAIERIQRALVAIEDDLDFLARTRRLAAGSSAL